jgi:hypothetical protein
MGHEHIFTTEKPYICDVINHSTRGIVARYMNAYTVGGPISL